MVGDGGVLGRFPAVGIAPTALKLKGFDPTPPRRLASRAASASSCGAREPASLSAH